MRILAADDEPLAREMLVDAISEAEPDAQICDFGKPSEVLSFAEENVCVLRFSISICAV